MRAIAVVMLLLPAPVASQGAEAPVAAVRGFLTAVKGRDCARAWTYLSAASRAYIECKSKEMIASAPYYAESFSAQNLYCRPTSVHRYHRYAPETARLKSQARGRAVVALERFDPEGFLFPGFFPTKKRVAPVEMDLTAEQSRWTIDVHASNSGPRSYCPTPPSRSQ